MALRSFGHQLVAQQQNLVPNEEVESKRRLLEEGYHLGLPDRARFAASFGGASQLIASGQLDPRTVLNLLLQSELVERAKKLTSPLELSKDDDAFLPKWIELSDAAISNQLFSDPELPNVSAILLGGLHRLQGDIERLNDSLHAKRRIALIRLNLPGGYPD